MISVTITDLSGRTLSGQTLDAFYTSIRHAKPLTVGINCALGARDMRPYLAELARIAECYVSSYPNAGLPNAFGEYDELPDETATLLRDFAESGFVNILGGCCGTTPDHIRAVAKAVAGVKPRQLPDDSWLNGSISQGSRGPTRGSRSAAPSALPSGASLGPQALASREPRAPTPITIRNSAASRPLTIRPDSNFQMIGERTNVTARRASRG